MARDKAPTDRLTVTLTTTTLDYLADLAVKGLHGSGQSDVARTLIEEGIRQLLDKGYLSPKLGADRGK